MNFTEALRIAFTAGSGRKVEAGETDRVEEVGWPYGIVGIAILVVVQAGLLFRSVEGLPPGTLVDLALVSAAALAMPFVIFGIAAAVVRQQARLPAAFLYLGLVFAALQVVSAVISSFGAGSSGFLVGILGAVTFLSARAFLRLGWPAAIGIAILVVIAFMGAGLLLFLLPSGDLFR
jgi:hypothetical protein